MRMSLFFLLLLLLPLAQAFEVAPEYTFFNESDALDFDGPEKINGEYYSDVAAFRRRLSDPEQRWTMTNHYDVIAGSLSGKEFYENQKLFLSKKLLPQIEARVLWFRDRDFEQSHSQLTLELLYWWNSSWAVAVNGSPSYEKSQNDVGLALVSSGFLEGESRIYVNFPNFQLNKRSINGERWGDGRAPMAMGFVSRSRAHEAAFRYESPLELVAPDDLRIYNFKRTTAQLKKWFDFADNRSLATFLFYENKFEGEAPMAGGTVLSQFRTRERWSGRMEWTQPIAASMLNVGLSYEHRIYTVAHESFRTENYLPYAWYTLPWKTHDTFEHRWRVGIDSAFFDASAPTTFLTEDIDTYRIDSRLNIALDLQTTDVWTLNLLFTFDTDTQNSDTPWEGGAAQLRIYF